MRKELAVKARLFFAERVDEVCLHLTAGRFDQEAGGGVEGGEGGEGVVGLSTLLFLLCHGRTNFRRSSFSCQAEDNIRVWTELEAERGGGRLRSRSAWMLSLAVSFATWQADREVLYRENAGLRSQVAKLEVGGSWVLSVLIFSCDRHRSRPANGPRPSWFAVSLQLPMLIDRWIRRSLRRRRWPGVAFSRAFQAFVNLPQE